MIDTNTLRHALAALDSARDRARQLEQQQRDLQSRDLAATDVWQTARQTMDDALAGLQLAEATDADVTAARIALETADEQRRGIERAEDKIRERITAQGALICSLEGNVSATMAELARPLIDGVRAEVEEYAKALGASLRLLYQLDACTRGAGSGFLTGEAASRLANSPGWVLEQFGIRAQDRMLLPLLRERVDNIKPAQLLALIEDS